MRFTQIPNDILFNSKLNIYSRVLFGIILSLSRENGYCFASNEYLADKIGGTARAVTNWILELKQNNLIDVQTVRTQGAVSRKIFIKERSFLEGTTVPEQEEPPFLSEGNNHSLAKGTTVPEQEEPPFPIIYNKENIILKDNSIKEVSEKQVFAKTPKEKKQKVLYVLPNDFSDELKHTFEDFMKYKKDKGQSYKNEKSVNLLIKKIQKHRGIYLDTEIVEVINQTMENNYSGIVYDWLERNRAKKPQTQPQQKPILKPIIFDEI